MAELNDIISKRLAEAFGEETQDVTARKLNMTQGNISKLVHGEQTPTVDTLVEVAKAYNVSVDWIIGISECREIDGLVIEKLTYGQLGQVLDYLIESSTIEIPDLVKAAEDNGIQYEEIEEDAETPVVKDPIFDSDYIKIQDRLLSYIMRRRKKLEEIDPEMLDVWRDKLKGFRELRLLAYSMKLQEAIDASSPARFKDGDWIELIERLSKMTESELHNFVKALKEKDGKEDGR